MEVTIKDIVPCPGFCEADFEPLANLLPSELTSPEVPVPPEDTSTHEKNRDVMKEACFKGIQ